MKRDPGQGNWTLPGEPAVPRETDARRGTDVAKDRTRSGSFEWSSHRFPTDEQPANSVTLPTSCASPTRSAARRTFGPVISIQRDLNCPLALLPVDDPHASSVGESYLVPDHFADRAARHRQRLFRHRRRFYSLLASDSTCTVRGLS